MKYIKETLFIGVFLLLLLILIKECSTEEIKPNKELIESEKDMIIDYQKIIDSLDYELFESNLELVDYQNKLQISEKKFFEFKKTPKYIEKIKYIKENISIDTLASNTIELENCIENSQYKDSAIVVLENSIDISEIQKDNFKKIIKSQNKIESQLNDNLLFEINETRKANRKQIYWKIATCTLAGFIIYDKIKN